MVRSAQISDSHDGLRRSNGNRELVDGRSHASFFNTFGQPVHPAREDWTKCATE